MFQQSFLFPAPSSGRFPLTLGDDLASANSPFASSLPCPETPPPGNSRHPGPRRPSRHRNPQQAVGEPCFAATVDWFSTVRISIADFLADASFSPLCSRSGASAGHLCPRRARSQRIYLRMPTACPWEPHARCYLAGPVPISPDARGLPAGVSRSFLGPRLTPAKNVTIPRTSRGHSPALARPSLV